MAVFSCILVLLQANQSAKMSEEIRDDAVETTEEVSEEVEAVDAE